MLAIFILTVGLFGFLFLGRSRLQVRQNYFFLIFSFFGILYICLIPAISFFLEMHQDYESIQLVLILFFLIPLFLTYRFLAHKIDNRNKIFFHVSQAKFFWFCILFLFFELIFSILAFRSGMYVRRIGTENIAELISRLDMFTLIVLRTHDIVVLPVIALLALLLPTLKEAKTSVLILGRITLFLICISFVVYALMNSRTLLVFLVITLYFPRLMHEKNKKLSYGKIALTLALLFYGLIVISNIRNHQSGDVNAKNILNPISFVTESDSDAFNKWEWIQRLDCVDLIAQMEPSLQIKGYEWGAAWERPLVTMFGQLIGLQQATLYKAEARTTAKTYLMEEHTDIALKDYPSCMLTDLWGNFWIYGLPLAALLVAGCFLALRYGLTASQSPAVFVTALVFAFYFIAFEKEFVDWMFGWLKLLPAIALLVIFNPIKKISFSAP